MTCPLPCVPTPRLEFQQVNQLRKGPFKIGGQSWCVLRSAAEDFFSSTDHRNSIFELLYGEILKDGGFDDPDAASDEHMRKVFEWCKVSLLSHGEGSDVKLSRWWAFEQTSREACRTKSLDLMLLIWLGVARKWWANPSQCPLFTQGEIVPDSGGQPLNGENDGAAGIDAGDQIAEDTEGPTAKRMSIDTGRKEARAARSKCANSLKYSCMQLCKPLNCRLRQLLTYAPEPLELFFREATMRLNTPRGVCDLHIDLASGALLEVVHSLFLHLTSGELARHIGLVAQDCEARTPYQKQQDQTVMTSAFRYILGLAGRLVELDLWYAMPPQVFVLGAHRSAGEVQWWLAEMEVAWRVLTKLEGTALSSDSCAAFLRSMSWPMHQLCREVRFGVGGRSLSRKMEFHRCVGLYAPPPALSSVPSVLSSGPSQRSTAIALWGPSDVRTTIGETQLSLLTRFAYVASATAE